MRSAKSLVTFLFSFWLLPSQPAQLAGEVVLVDNKSPAQLRYERLRRMSLSLLAGVAVGIGCQQLPPEYQVYCGLVGKFLVFLVGGGS